MERLKLEIIESIIGIQKTTLDAFEKHGSEDTDYIPTLDKCILSAMEELKKYRIAEDQGLILKLPCKEGSRVWLLGYTYECEYEYDCKLEFDKNKCEADVPCKHEYKKWRAIEKVFNYKMLKSIGKTIFLTKEEAEQALAKMKEV